MEYTIAEKLQIADHIIQEYDEDKIYAILNVEEDTEITTEGIPSLEFILLAICEYFNCELESVLSKSRKREYAYVRHYFSYLAVKYYDRGFLETGRSTEKKLIKKAAFLMGRSRASVYNSLKTVKNIIEVDKHFSMNVNKLEYFVEWKFAEYRNKHS